MFIVANRVIVAEPFLEAFEQRFRSRAGQIDQQPGFVSMQVLKPVKPEIPYVILTSWINRQSFDDWVCSDDFKRAHANPMPKEAFIGESTIEMHEVIVSADRTS
ncbi:MAG: antibiotic biosynthesis monooxygenase [Candidatus Thiodiazotropha sp. (ex Codakia rugifera)]|nr:antibiotic biosynthesis monooxygenase [Candidatus Thiodiazotropha sp. (ex Codakia rugifera)]